MYVPSLKFNYDILYYRPSLEFQNTLFYILCSGHEEEVMFQSVFYHCICACLHCCYNFNPCSCHLLPYVCMLWSWYHVCHCFKVMSLVEILLMQHKIYIFIIIKNMKTLTFGQSVKNSAMHTNDIVCAKGQLCSWKRGGDNYANLYVPNFVCTCEPIMNWSWC